MSDLDTLSRQRAGLPTFAGASLQEQLLTGQAEAAKRLAKYVGGANYSVEQADAVIHKVRSWADRESSSLSAVLSSSATDLPEQLKLQLGATEAQQFVLATYSLAAAGLGPWASGAVAANVTAGNVPEPRITEDAAARLAIFGSIVKWDDDGDLATLFAPAQALVGLGLAPVIVAGIIVAVAIVLVVGAAVVLQWVTAAKVVSANVELMQKMCTDAQKAGDTATVNKCLQMSAGLQQSALDRSDPLTTAVKAAAIVGGMYVLVVYGLPELTKWLGPRRGRGAVSA